ncbi:hypothetical protein MMC13_003315 [Lambiella insularis]|nr:hypothetical protein [Lambiella insularis]
MNLGVVIGLAGTSAIMQKILHSALRSGLTGFPNREEIISSALSNVNYVARLDGKLGQIVVNAYVTSLKYAFGSAIVL